MTPSTAAEVDRPVELWLHGREVHRRQIGMSAGCAEPIRACDGWSPIRADQRDRYDDCPGCFPNGFGRQYRAVA